MPVSKRVGKSRLQRQRRHDRDQIGVAAALAEAVQRALDLAHAGLDGGERIGHRLAGVVMGMDAEMVARYAGRDDLVDDGANLRRLRAAIGVAQHHPARAGVVGRPGAGQRIVGIGLEAVEEMLAVDHRFLADSNRRLDRGLDRFEVFLVGAAERDAHMIVPALGDEADGVRLRLDQRGKSRIVGRRHPCPLGHAEGDEFCARRALLGKEGGVGRVGAGIAALDIIDAELVEQLGDGDLVLDGKVDARRLLAIAQGGVEEDRGVSLFMVARCASTPLWPAGHLPRKGEIGSFE